MAITRSTMIPAAALLLAAVAGGFSRPVKVAERQINPNTQVTSVNHLTSAELHMLHPCSAWGTGPVNKGGFSCPTAHAISYGGPVISNIKVYMVLYGTGTYASYITNDTAPSMASFYSQVVNSSYMDWLNEYNTGSIKIGRGTYAGKYSITPSSGNNGTTISDAQVQAELNAQIAAGKLPQPDSNTFFVVHFRAGQTIQSGGNSCQAGGFCAYHGSATTATGTEYYYAVVPDFHSSGCASGCGSSSEYNNVCSTVSHEMVETITDPDVADATVFGPPLGWYWYSSDSCQGELADVCNQNQATFAGTDGKTYTVQKIWSNSAAGCIASLPISLTKGVWLVNRATGTYQQTITLKNTGSTTITGPISLIVSNVAGGTISAQTGVTGTILPLGSAYVNYTGNLAANASTTLTLSFKQANTSSQIGYDLRVVAGPGTR
jgi:hypothetical protein